jgi:hypothetical protein
MERPPGSQRATLCWEPGPRADGQTRGRRVGRTPPIDIRRNANSGVGVTAQSKRPRPRGGPTAEGVRAPGITAWSAPNRAVRFARVALERAPTGVRRYNWPEGAGSIIVGPPSWPGHPDPLSTSSQGVESRPSAAFTASTPTRLHMHSPYLVSHGAGPLVSGAAPLHGDLGSPARRRPRARIRAHRR